jgi:MFS transporter, OFA family, oxalate/formate antiporter
MRHKRMRTISTRAWTVTSAATGINLILGVFYAWSVLKKGLVEQLGWSNLEASIPYTVSAMAFATSMVFSGHLQDRIGPRKVTTIGGLVYGGSLFLCGVSDSPLRMTLSFGLGCGLGLGIAGSTVLPTALKWYGTDRRGIVSGIVASGVALAAVYMSPLSQWLISKVGVASTFYVLGTVALILIVLLAQFLRIPTAEERKQIADEKMSENSPAGPDTNWREMLRTRSFYGLWVCYALSASAGLMIIAHLATIAKTQAGWEKGYYIVSILAVFNALGRLVGGYLSDVIGREWALRVTIAVQAANMFGFGFYETPASVGFGGAITGLAYGSTFALFPTITADQFGLKNLGVNYGLVFTGWGVAGVTGPILAAWVVDATGSYATAYSISACMLIAAFSATFLTRNEQSTTFERSRNNPDQA